MTTAQQVHTPKDSDQEHLRGEILRSLGTQLSTLLTTARAFSAEIASRFDPALSNGAFQILQKLHTSGPMRAMRIAEALAMDRSALSRLLQQLLSANLVEAIPDPLDGRAALYKMTDDARQRMELSMAVKASQFFERFNGWSESDLRMLSVLLQRLNASEAVAPPNR